MSHIRVLALAVVAALPLSAVAAGGHDAIGCVGCHAIHTAKDQIIFAVSANKQVVNAKIAKVPGELLREGGKFECLGCHDPHPSNPYYKYLRVDTAKGSKMDAFCAVCHPIKADVATVQEKAVLFT